MVVSRKNKLDKTRLLIGFVAKKLACTVVDFIDLDLKLIPYTYITKRKIGLIKSNIEVGSRYESILKVCQDTSYESNKKTLKA